MLPLFPLAMGLWLATSPTFLGTSFSGAKSPVPAVSGTRRGVSGTFIQFQRWMLELGPRDWEKELEAARGLGLDTIVLQWARYDDTSFVSDSGENAVDFIFEEADRHGMRVFLGLPFQSAWWQRWKDEAFLREPADVEFLWNRFRGHRSLSGWYLPQEFPTVDLSDAEIDRIAAFYRRLADTCRRQSVLPVALSTFLGTSEGRLPAEGVEYVLKRLLSHAAVDIVLVQDGAGALATDALNEHTLSFLASAEKAALRARVAPWTIMEVFEPSPAGRAPATFERLRKLGRLESGNPLILFDFFHYLSPYRGSTQATLYSRLLESGGIGQ